MTPQEIKFRGISFLTNDWVFGYLSKRESLYFIGNTYHINPSSLGMFTGLHDKNGKEIYGAIGDRGGDVTDSAIFGKATIKWDEYKSGFVPEWHNSDMIEASIVHATKFAEIVGNQWEVDNGK